MIATAVRPGVNGHSKPTVDVDLLYGPDRTAPVALDAEEAVLGSILIDAQAYFDVASILRADDFYLHKHRWIWDSIVHLNEQGLSVDTLTLTDELEQRNQLADVGGMAYIARLLTSVPTSLHAEAYARIIEREATRRRLMEAATAIAKLAAQEERDINELLSDALATVSAVGERKQSKSKLSSLVVPASEALIDGLKVADWLTYRFIERGELAMITAPGGTMKSLLMLSWAVAVASGAPWLSRTAGGAGLESKMARVLWINTDNGQATHENRLAAIMRAQGLTDIPLFSVTTTTLELADRQCVTDLRALADELGTSVLVIDTLSGALTGVNENSAEEMTRPAAHLRELADYGLTVVCLHHPPKNDANGSRGSSVLPNKVDRVYSLARTGDLLTITWQKIRNTPAPSRRALAAVENDPSTDALVAVNFFEGESANQDAADDVLRKRVLEALGGEQAGINTRALKTRCKCRWEDLKRVLTGLRLNGVIDETKGPKNASIYKLSGE